MGKKSPSERGYHPVMLRQSTFERLQGVGAGLSADGAVIRLLDEAYNTHAVTEAKGMIYPDDVEQLFASCRVTDRRMKDSIRLWFAKRFGWDE